jgi:hypothetical protein
MLEVAFFAAILLLVSFHFLAWQMAIASSNTLWLARAKVVTLFVQNKQNAKMHFHTFMQTVEMEHLSSVYQLLNSYIVTEAAVIVRCC